MGKRRKKVNSETEGNSLVTVDNLKLVDGQEEKKEKSRLLKMDDASMRVALERELRRYVKRSGGLRKGLEDKKKVVKRVKQLCKSLGRDASNMKKVSWDHEIHVPGLDNPTVKGMFIAD